jgi:hypothetical protein
MKSIEAQLNEVLEQITTLRKAVTFYRLKAAKAERELLMHKANLTLTAKDRLHSAFINSLDNAGLREAINIELRGVK